MDAEVGNPYRPAPGSLPPFLAGRDGELAAVRTAIAMTLERGAASPIVNTGLRGMGKTALLRTATRMAEAKGGIVLYGEAGDDLALEDAFRRSLQRAKRDTKNLSAKLAAAIERAIDRIPVPIFEVPGGAGEVSLKAQHGDPDVSFAEALETLNAAAARSGRFIAVCIDEIQDAQAQHLRPVISYVHETSASDAPLLLLGAGLPGTPDHLKRVRTYTERWRYFDLGLLNDEEASAALLRPAASRNVAFDDDALAVLVDESAGYPFFIQEYGSAAWSARSGQRITIAAVNDAVKGVRKSLESSLYERRFRTLTARELRYILALADLGPGIHTIAEVSDALGVQSRELSSIRNQLVRKDVVVAPAHGLIEFRIPLTERYIARQRDEFERRAAVGDVSFLSRPRR